MQTLYQILGIVGALAIIFILYQTIKNKPEQFSKENLHKSLSSMGVLALLLIGFVTLLIVMLRHS